MLYGFLLKSLLCTNVLWWHHCCTIYHIFLFLKKTCHLIHIKKHKRCSFDINKGHSYLVTVLGFEQGFFWLSCQLPLLENCPCLKIFFLKDPVHVMVFTGYCPRSIPLRIARNNCTKNIPQKIPYNCPHHRSHHRSHNCPKNNIKYHTQNCTKSCPQNHSPNHPNYRPQNSSGQQGTPNLSAQRLSVYSLDSWPSTH